MTTSQPVWSELLIGLDACPHQAFTPVARDRIANRFASDNAKAQSWKSALGHRMILKNLFEKDFPSRLTWLKSSERVRRKRRFMAIWRSDRRR